MTWQPIETAPKDGTTIDLWAGERLANCRWMKWEDEGPGEWRQEYSEASGSTFPIGNEPTHWMPLPAPPNPQQEERG